jgi:hypothetical protein
MLATPLFREKILSVAEELETTLNSSPLAAPF